MDMGYAKETTHLRVKKSLLIDKSMKKLTEDFLNNERETLFTLEKALKTKDFACLFTIGDQLYGHGTSFGFPVISELGKKIELAAVEKNVTCVDGLISCLKLYLDRISIVYT